MTENSVEYAIDLIKSGKKTEGKNLLIELIIKDPHNEEAWLWMSSASSGAERINCLEKALEINPQNEYARKMLKKLTAPDAELEQSRELESADREFSNASVPEKKAIPLEEDVVFSPNIGFIFWVHIIPWILVFGCGIILAIISQGWYDWKIVGMLISLCVFTCVLLMIRKMNVFKVRITKTGLNGPLFFIYAWLKHEIPLADIDLKKTGTSLGFLGYYRIRSYEGTSVYLIGYSEETLLQIASLIRHYQSQ